jgi:hypothetical protein
MNQQWCLGVCKVVSQNGSSDSVPLHHACHKRILTALGLIQAKQMQLTVTCVVVVLCAGV